MTSQPKAIIPAVTGVVAIVAIFVAVGVGWPAWVTIVTALVICAVGALIYLAVVPGRQPVQQEIFVPPPPAPEPPPAVQIDVVQGVNLASALPDYEFILDATVYWRMVATPTSTPHLRPGARAIDTIIERAATVAATEQPGMAVRLQHRLNDVLGVVQHDRSGRLEVWADQVRTVLSETDAQRLRTLSDVRKDQAVWEHQRRFECDKRQYLTEDVLRSTGIALVWWLSRNESDVTKAAELIGTMAKLSSAAKDEDFSAIGSDGAGQPFDLMQLNGSRSPVDLVTALMGALGLDDEQRALFAARVATDIASTGDAAAAEQIRLRFDVITDDDPEPGAHAWPEDDSTERTAAATADALDD